MNAAKYSTENAKDPQDVFKLYHAFNEGEKKGNNTKSMPVMIIGLILGSLIGAVIVLLLVQAKIIIP